MPAGRPKTRSGQYERTTLEVRIDLLTWMNCQDESRRELIEEALELLKSQRTRGFRERYSAILENYLASPDFRDGVISSTQAGFGGSGYSVELFPDGSFRNLWDNQIGNRYESEGVILRLPALDADDMQEYIDDGAGDEEDFLKEQFECEREEIVQSLRETLKEKLA
jgi:hypothetical protein